MNSTKGALNKVYLTGSGSDATEAAVKLARQFYYDQDPESPRKVILARSQSYHGGTITALNLSDMEIRQAPYKAIFADIVQYVSSCFPYRQQFYGESDLDFVARKAAELDTKFIEIGPDKVMAFILEPVSGAALGCVTDVPGYLTAMKEVCHKHGALLIFDEVMCGMGRTGFLYACQMEGV